LAAIFFSSRVRRRRCRRPAVSPRTSNVQQLPQAQQQDYINQLKASPLYANSGSSVGFGYSGGLHLGIHF
jgi:hypothetical protein